LPAALIAPAVVALLFELTRPYRPDNLTDAFIDRLIGRDFRRSELNTPETADITYVELPADADLDGLLYITGERAAYRDGDMTLLIPKLNPEMPVSDGTARADLNRGPSLFAPPSPFPRPSRGAADGPGPANSFEYRQHFRERLSRQNPFLLLRNAAIASFPILWFKI
jgi:hypothetical protein